MIEQERDRRHADLLLNRKRTDKSLTKTKSDLEAAAKKLRHAYEHPSARSSTMPAGFSTGAERR